MIMLKRMISILLMISVMAAMLPVGAVFADPTDAGTVTISNQYIKVIVNEENGGYVIATLDGDILKKSDDNAALTHRGEHYDTSFTSFRIDSDEYVFGEKYGLFGSKSSVVDTRLTEDNTAVQSTWSVGDFTVEQKITLVNNDASEQLGTAMITYTVKNNAKTAKNVKSRVLMDTRLGEKDYGYYEVPKQNLGQGYAYFESEKTWDSTLDPTIRMPADYFVRDNPYSSNIVGYGVNSVFAAQKPYKMTFAHWANIASTVFDYTPDETLHFTNDKNDKKTADSAAALYYDLGSLAPEQEKSFSTYYGVTANLKNKDNKVILNTTAPSKLEFKDAARTAYRGSEGTDNVVRINVNMTNPLYAGKTYQKLAVVVYALGFETQRQTDSGSWVTYNNADPICTEVLDFKPGENRVTYFDFQFTPKERAQLGTFAVKVFDMDESVNELGYYAEDYCLAGVENHMILPGRDAKLPAITLSALAPDIIYNRDIRYLTVQGRGMEFFRSDLLNKVELRGENGLSYEVPLDHLIYGQGENPDSMSIMLDTDMEPGVYRLHFVWKDNAKEEALEGVPADFTSDAMVVHVSGDIRYHNTCYGVVTVQRDKNETYRVVAYKDEAEFEKAAIAEEKLLLSLRGDIQKDRANPRFYRLVGKDKDVNINHILNYRGDDLTVEEKEDGTVEVLMDGKITTVGANTTVRNGTAAFRLKGGTEYIIPEYDESGVVQENGELSGNQDFIELKWDNAFDTLTTVGGFLIDMKYGVLGKIQNDDQTMSDIMSFGGSLDLGFMTPGGAAAVRQNTAAGARWTTAFDEVEHEDAGDGYTFGLTFDEDAGEFRSQVKERDVPPANNEAERVEAGAAIRDILYGGKRPGYIGINMEAHIALPQIVKFLPNKIEGELSINTIGGYRVGVNAAVETGNIALALALVVKSSPSGAPIPDKMYFSMGGFEPGVNVDGLGIAWVTGGGGGLDQLYETIYGKDGVPPLTVLLHVEFDITKILTGNADLELSLRSLKISFDDLSLKMLKDAKFLKGGEIAVGWYPNFNLNLSAGVKFMQIMDGSFTITAAAGKDVADFVQFVLNVALSLPQYIPIVGGMELAAAELGGGSQKVWGSVEVLSLIRVGFTYYWGGSVSFTHGNPSGIQTFADLASDDEGVKRTKQLYREMLKPMELGTDAASGETQFASIGANLSYSAGSTAVSDFAARVQTAEQDGVVLMDAQGKQTQILTNHERTCHLVTFGDACDYILSISRADGAALTQIDLERVMTVKQGGNAYALRYYTAPGGNATDAEKKEALKNANINVSGNAAYIAVPKSDTNQGMQIAFSDQNAYDISAVRVNPIGTLTEHRAQMGENGLMVNWNGENLSDRAKIIVSVSDGDAENGIVLNDREILANEKTAVLPIPEQLASGTYKVSLTLSDENICYDSYDAGAVTVLNRRAPGTIERVGMENCGDDKLKITVDTGEEKFDGYLVEVYEDGALADTGLYFAKGEEIIVGGRYEMPLLDDQGNPIPATDESGNPILDGDGNPRGKTVPVGYTPQKEYVAKVRLCNLEKDAEGNEVYHCGAYQTSPGVTLKASTRPDVSIRYEQEKGAILLHADVPVCGELYIDAKTDDGAWYSYKDAAQTISQDVALSDGEHTIEFYAKDEEGDHAIVQEIVSVDTTAPVVMLSAPKNGDRFDGDSITVTATAEREAEYRFRINGESVSPTEADIFAEGMLKATLPLGAAKNTAKMNLEVLAKDAAGNETVKNVVLINKNVSDIVSVQIMSDDKPIADGTLTLAEGESAKLRVLGTLESGDSVDITDLSATSLAVIGGVSAKLDGATVTAALAGKTLVRAGFALGGDEFLYDGVVVDTVDRMLVYTALDAAIAEAKRLENRGYTEDSWNALQDAIQSAEQIKETEGITQNDIDRAATAVSDAIAGLTKKSSASGGSSGGGIAYYTVSFRTNGGSEVKSQRVQSGLSVERPEDPVKDGYTFEGWYLDKQFSVPYDFADKVKKSFTLYARWTENEPDAEAWENPFEDVREGDWFYRDVAYAVKNGWFRGTETTTFAPNEPTTRAMFAAVLYRAEGEPQVDGSVPFADVPADAYYEKAVLWAVQNGIVNGVSETEFAPDQWIQREQIAAMMHRLAKVKGYDVSVGEDTNLLSYEDAERISEYAIPSMQYAVGSGMINGKTETMLAPGDHATRAEIAAILRRFSETNHAS